jgi:phage terminase large subunit GpA-like protein
MTPVTAPAAAARLRGEAAAAVRQALRPPLKISLPEWADNYRRLSRDAGNVGGVWQTSRVEIARGPMMAVTEPGVQIITLMVATQLLKTSLLENVIGFFAHTDPCPVLLAEAKDEAADAFSRERLAPMIAATPCLRDLIGDKRTRRTENTLRFKKFPGGFLAIASAGSPTNLAMRAIRVTLLDEIDKYETTKEGDPVLLAEERSSTFTTRRLSVRACSPTWAETSRIYRSYEESDQRRAYLCCPHCGHWQDLDFFRHVHWEKRGTRHLPETAQLGCEQCGRGWSEAERLAALQRIEWRQTRTFLCCGEGQDPRAGRLWQWDATAQTGYALCQSCGRRAVPNRHAGFTASKLYSPWITVVELAEAWLRAKDDPETKQTFYNTQLGLPFKTDALKEVPAEALLRRREQWDGVPDEVLVITAGVDVQPGGTASEGRLEVEVVGWGLGEESWSLAHEVFTGDPAQNEVWRQLDDFLVTPWRRVDGRMMAIRACCIDSGGHNTQEAYRFAQARIGRNIWAIKGASDRSQWSPIWPSSTRAKGGRYRAGYRPIIIGVNAAKEAVRQRLLIAEPGAGYCHFPVGRPAGYFEQLTAERLVIERKAGSRVRRWVAQSHRANEALDCRVYAYAALWGLYHVRRLKLERAAQLIQMGLGDVPPLPVAAAAPPNNGAPMGRPRARRSIWVRG